MPLDALTEDEIRVVQLRLECVAAVRVIPHDSEFQTIMGIDVPTLRSVLKDWPEVDESKKGVWLPINNSFNNVLGYPHSFMRSGSCTSRSARPRLRECSPSREATKHRR
jgi:hypothetical protein